MSNFRCSNALFNGTIIINTTAGATVTATTTATSRVFTAVANAGGVATIPVKKRGTYAIASTGTTRIGHAEVLTTTPVTAQYHWDKYQAPLVYTKANQYYEATVWTPIRSGNYEGWSIYQRATSYTFNTNNGYYNLSGGYSSTISKGQNAYAIRTLSGSTSYPYCSTPGQGQSCTEMFQAWEISSNNGIGCVGYYSGMNGFGVWDGDPYYGGKAGAYRWYSTNAYHRGEYIGVANGANIDTYPIDARFSDGYWYVAI